MTVDPVEAAAFLNTTRDPWSRAMCIQYTHVSRDEVRADVTINETHWQGYGIVHGGVHSGVIETIASVGAAVDQLPAGRSVVGLENHTSFVRAVRGGTLHATAKPITRGKRSQLWEGTIVDADGKIVATGRVRLLCLEPDAALAGEKPSAKLPSE
ncbi:MAG: PaaI family thioesterase [Polyangiaceae bacterium]